MTTAMQPRSTAPAGTSRPAQPVLASIQCLRGVAALLVVFFHAQTAASLRLAGTSLLHGFQSPAQVGSIGVDIFFVISGFIMVHVSRDRFGRRGATTEFLARRVIRIVPLYWLATILMVVLLLAVPRAFDTLRFDLRNAVASFLFLPTTNSAGEMVPLLGVGWTLSYEMLFYVVFASLLWTSLRTSLVASGLLFAAAAIAGRLWPQAGPTGVMLTSDRFLEFFAGECVAAWSLRGRPLTPRAARLLLALGISVLIAHVFFGELDAVPLLTVAAPAAALVMALVSLEMRELLRFPRWLQRIGDESYSLYLSHSITNAFFFKVWVAANASRVLPVDASILLALVNAVVWGRLLHRTVERSMTRALARAWRV
jgi:exopolysaccharide production protein ExoZ